MPWTKQRGKEDSAMTSAIVLINTERMFSLGL